MKYLVSAVVFILLFVVPAGSWYYLQSGLDYRRAALAELEPKGKFAVDGISDEMLKAKTTLIQTTDVGEDVLTEIYDQYKKSETFQVMTSQPSIESFGSWRVIDVDLTRRISSTYGGAGFVLVDTAMMVRNTYPADLNGVRKLIEHTSIVLPRVREMDIKLKNND